MKIEAICAEIFLFQGLTNVEINNLLAKRSPSVQKYKSGDRIMGCDEKFLGVMTSGRAQVRSTANGAVMRELHSLDVFGAAQVYLERGIDCTEVYAKTECSVLAFSADCVRALVREDFRIAENLISFLADRVDFLNQKINDFTAGSATDKLITYLLRLPVENGIATLPSDLTALARMLDMGRASLYRALDRLLEAGLIEKLDKYLIVSDPAALAKYRKQNKR